MGVDAFVQHLASGTLAAGLIWGAYMLACSVVLSPFFVYFYVQALREDRLKAKAKAAGK